MCYNEGCKCAFLRQCEQALVIHHCDAKKQLALLHIGFTAGSWPTLYCTAALIAPSLGLLFPSLGAKITTPIVIYTFFIILAAVSAQEGRNMLIFILLLSFSFLFFPPLFIKELEETWPCCSQWEFASNLTKAVTSQSVSKLDPCTINRYTSTDSHP